jgi:hypothetical protein
VGGSWRCSSSADADEIDDRRRWECIAVGLCLYYAMPTLGFNGVLAKFGIADWSIRDRPLKIGASRNTINVCGSKPEGTRCEDGLRV